MLGTLLFSTGSAVAAAEATVREPPASVDEIDVGSSPVLAIRAGTDSVHVEYPTVLRWGNELHMLYSAYGDDETWRIRGASSADDGFTWTGRRTVIDIGENLRFVAFPAAVEHPDGGVLVLFSASTNDDPGYDSIMASTGPTVFDLGPPQVAVDVAGLDPAVWYEAGQFHMTFTLVDPGADHVTTLEHYISADGVSWSREPALRMSDRSQFYTQNTFVLDGVRVWAINQNVESQHSIVLACVDGVTGQLVDIDGSAFARVDPDDPAWNQYRYGPDFVDLDDGLIMFSNGIRLDETDGNGMIGRTRMEFHGLKLPESCRGVSP